jgi:hypothetical protein
MVIKNSASRRDIYNIQLSSVRKRLFIVNTLSSSKSPHDFLVGVGGKSYSTLDCDRSGVLALSAGKAIPPVQ